MKLDVKAFALTCGLVWAFFDGLVGGAVFAWLYNLIAQRNSNKNVV